MWLLLACVAPTPVTTLPAAPPAAHPVGYSVDRLLTPTALGASNELLCPWARGEPVPDASIDRWLAEERLVWRIYDVDADTLGGRPLAQAADLAAAARSLDERCGTTLPREVLVAAGPDTPTGAVFTGLTHLGQQALVPFRLLVERPVVGTPASPDVASAPVEPAPTELAEPIGAGGDGGGLAAAVAGALTTPPRCGVVSAKAAAPWSSTVGAVDGAVSPARDVMLALEQPSDVAPAAPRAAAAGPRGPVVTPHLVVATLPIAVPTAGGGPCLDPIGAQVGEELGSMETRSAETPTAPTP